MTDIDIHYSRPGKGITHYCERLVDDNPIRLKTINNLSPDFSLKWCEENWWLNGYIPRGILIGSEAKYIFYRQWFSVMKLMDVSGDALGYYVDVIAPVRRKGAELYITDLFLDLWISATGSFIEMDREEFEEGFLSGLITAFQYKNANKVIEMLKNEVANGDFFRRFD